MEATRTEMNLQEIALLTDNLRETETFYTEVLALEVCSRDGFSISFRAGQSILTFSESDNEHPRYHFAFNIPCNQLEEALAWTSQRVAIITNHDGEQITSFDSWNAKSVYFYDNNGNVLEFIARFDLQNPSEKPFTAGSIVCISEIGIVTDHPLELADKLISEQASWFEKGAKSDQFAILGDDNGLFIIVGTGRNWYPTHVPATRHRTRIKVEIDGLVWEVSVDN